MTDHVYIECANDVPELTPDEIRYLQQSELAEYEEKNSMTPGEKRALRRWVAAGHSVYDHPDSRFVCLYGVFPPPDFLDVYRMDKELSAALRGKSKAEKTAYLMNYLGYSPEDGDAAEEPL